MTRAVLLLHALLHAAAPDAAAPDAAGHWSCVVEAEAAAIVESPAHIVAWPGASGGRCVRMSHSDSPDIQPVTGAGGSAFRGSFILDFTVPSDGAYSFWARLQWHCTCSRRVGFRSTATAVEPDDFCGENYISSSVTPRVWHWIKIGTVLLDAGSHEFVFTQEGHLALVDAFAFSTDPDYSPPGHDESVKEQYFREDPDMWIEEVRGGVYALGEGDFSSFTLKLAIQVPGGDQTAGIEFCAQPDGQAYRLSVQHLPERIMRLTLYAGEKPIGEATADDTEAWAAVELTRIGESIRVGVNGIRLIDVRDSEFASGRIRIVALGSQRLVFEHLSVKPLQTHTELFGAGCAEWPSVSGDWRRFEDAALLGSGLETAVAFAPWALGDCFSFSADVSLMTGSAGIAFNAVGSDNFSAVALEPAEDCNDTVRLVAVSAEGSHIERRHAGAHAASEWYRLGLDRDGSRFAVSLDGRALHRWELRDWQIDGKLGLFVSDGAALFARVEATQDAPAYAGSFSFERSAAMWSRCHWNDRLGKVGFIHHPDFLVLTPEDGEISFELRRPVSRNVSLYAIIPLRARARMRQASIHNGGSMPGLVMPGDPVVGFRLLDPRGRAAYEVAADYPELRQIRVVKDGEVLGQRMPSQVRASAMSEFELYLRVNPESIEAGLDGLAEMVASTPAADEEGPYTVALFASNMPPGLLLEVAELNVGEIHPPLIAP